MALVSTRKKGPVQRQAHVARTGPGQVHLNVLARCRKSFAAARNFRELVALVREAEKKLTAVGIDDVDDRVTALRGLYYGTEWSTDFLKEKSTTRNLGFRRYTATPFDPPDVRPFLECNLGKALQGSQDCKDAGRLVDFGHLIIGLDSRRKWVSRSYNLAEGGTGLEIVTWLGDLGGGAAMLAKDRVKKPDTPAIRRMTGSDFGGPINLEGDVAGYVVAHDPTDLDGPSDLHFKTPSIADALEHYLDPAKSDHWKKRAFLFLSMFGGRWTGDELANRDDIVEKMGKKIESFGALYLLVRLKDQGRFDEALVSTAATLIGGASRELAALFVDALVFSHNKGGATIAARSVPQPAISAPGEPNSLLKSAAEGSGWLEKAGSSLKRLFE